MAMDRGGGGYTTKKKAPARKANGPTAGYGYGGHGVNYSDYTNLKRSTGSYDPRGNPYLQGGGGGGSRGGSSGGGGGYGGYGGGGGGGYSAAQAAADEEKRKAKARALVEQFYKQGVGALNQAKAPVIPALNKYAHQTLAQLNSIYGQNRAVTGATTKDIQGIQGNALRALAERQAMLQRDLGAQGADTQALGLAGADYQGDARATGAAQDTFNKRLGQVMEQGAADDKSSAHLVYQSGLGQLSVNYQQALQALQAARIQSLIGLV